MFALSSNANIAELRLIYFRATLDENSLAIEELAASFEEIKMTTLPEVSYEVTKLKSELPRLQQLTSAAKDRSNACKEMMQLVTLFKFTSTAHIKGMLAISLIMTAILTCQSLNLRATTEFKDLYFLLSSLQEDFQQALENFNNVEVHSIALIASTG